MNDVVERILNFFIILILHNVAEKRISSKVLQIVIKRFQYLL